MKDLKTALRLPNFIWRKMPKPAGRLGVWLLGHRGYVGSYWEQVGAGTLEILQQQGLQPHHYTLDIACGSLRAGVKLIPYLETGHYMGVDQEALLIERGLAQELDPQVYAHKQPRFAVNSNFDFSSFATPPDYALAVSLFSHLPPDLIKDCLSKLRAFIKPDGVFIATFLTTDRPQANPTEAHPHLGFRYTWEEMEAFGAETGWNSERFRRDARTVSQEIIKYTVKTGEI